jgi:monovalent cation:H+ antiporter-2, CPA2 family
MRYPVGVALCVAFALAQIGEFSFILAEEAAKFKVFPDEAYDSIVACALISISINPLFFQALDYFKPRLTHPESLQLQQRLAESPKPALKAIVIGFDAVGQAVVDTLEKLGYRPVIMDRDVDIVAKLIEEKREAVYGEASYPNMLELAEVGSASLLIITLSDLIKTLDIIQYAHQIHPDITIIARAHNAEEQNILHKMGVEVVCDDEEIGTSFKRTLLEITRGVKKA